MREKDEVEGLARIGHAAVIKAAGLEGFPWDEATDQTKMTTRAFAQAVATALRSEHAGEREAGSVIEAAVRLDQACFMVDAEDEDDSPESWPRFHAAVAEQNAAIEALREAVTNHRKALQPPERPAGQGEGPAVPVLNIKQPHVSHRFHYYDGTGDTACKVCGLDLEDRRTVEPCTSQAPPAEGVSL